MSSLKPEGQAPQLQAQKLSDNERAVLEAIRSTPFGSVEVVVHQSKIVQVVKTEKVKLDSP